MRARGNADAARADAAPAGTPRASWCVGASSLSSDASADDAALEQDMRARGFMTAPTSERLTSRHGRSGGDGGH